MLGPFCLFLLQLLSLVLQSHLDRDILAQKILGLVGVEVLGFNQHHQETIGSWEVADGQKDLPGPCGCLLKTGG